MEVLELRRALGLIRVVVDERGVTRHGPVSTASLAWDEIIDYRLTAELIGRTRLEAYLPDDGAVAWTVTAAVAASRRPDRFRFGIALRGATGRLGFGTAFDHAELGVAMILDRVARPLGRQARAAFERDGVGRFGPLTLADDAIAWDGRPALPRARVECVELFAGSPVRLRVMARGKAFPYASARLAGIPNLVAALDLAHALGYAVRGRSVLAAIGA